MSAHHKPPRHLGPLESEITEGIRAYLRKRGAWEMKVLGGGRGVLKQRAGIPDLLVCYRGLFVALEVKRPRGKVSDAQALEIRRIQEAQGVAQVATGLPDVIKILDALDGALHDWPPDMWPWASD